MSFAHLFYANNYNLFSASLNSPTVTLSDDTTYPITWDPYSTGAFVNTNNTSLNIIQIQLTGATGLAAGANSATMRINNSLITPTCGLLGSSSDYSGISPTGSSTANCPYPTLNIRGGHTGYVNLQIVSDGYAGMSNTDSLKVHLLIC